jgi:hypothetical protein
LDGRGAGAGPHVLPVPLPAELRNIDSDYEYLVGTLRCTIREWGRTIFDGKSELAGLEIGSPPQGGFDPGRRSTDSRAWGELQLSCPAHFPAVRTSHFRVIS